MLTACTGPTCVGSFSCPYNTWFNEAVFDAGATTACTTPGRGPPIALPAVYTPVMLTPVVVASVFTPITEDRVPVNPSVVMVVDWSVKASLSV